MFNFPKRNPPFTLNSEQAEDLLSHYGIHTDFIDMRSAIALSALREYLFEISDNYGEPYPGTLNDPDYQIYGEYNFAMHLHAAVYYRHLSDSYDKSVFHYLLLFPLIRATRYNGLENTLPSDFRDLDTLQAFMHIHNGTYGATEAEQAKTSRQIAQAQILGESAAINFLGGITHSPLQADILTYKAQGAHRNHHFLIGFTPSPEDNLMRYQDPLSMHCRRYFKLLDAAYGRDPQHEPEDTGDRKISQRHLRP